MKVLAIIYLISFACAWAGELPAGCDVVAQTQYGPVCGRRRPATNGALYASFRGIRYARAPLRELRFAEPQPPDSHEDIFDASEHGPICPQYDELFNSIMQFSSMDEDCLRVNVHTPLSAMPGAANDSCPVPVLFFIHGGSFAHGSGDADLQGPEYLMAGQDIVLVTINYRLGAMGFLSLFSKEIPGNAGLRDAVFALKWVRDNIRNFGGDPEEVTVFGTSAGGAMTHFLSISPSVQEQKLFKRAYVMSGTATSGFYGTSRRYAEFMATNFLLAAEIDADQTTEEIHKELINTPADKLIEAYNAVRVATGVGLFAPVEETPIGNLTAIVPNDPEQLLSEGYGKNIVMWLSYCNNEAEVYRSQVSKIRIQIVLNLLPALTVPLNIVFGSDVDTVPSLTMMMSEEYFNSTYATLNKFLPAISDGYFKYPAIRVVKKRISTCASPTYMSEFAYGSPNTPYKILKVGNWSGAAHSEDFTFIFRVNSILGNNTVNELAQDTDDSRMKSWMTSLVTQFVKTGSPVPEGDESLWPATGQQLRHLYMATPWQYQVQALSPYLENKVKFFDQMNLIGRGI